MDLGIVDQDPTFVNPNQDPTLKTPYSGLNLKTKSGSDLIKLTNIYLCISVVKRIEILKAVF